MNYDNKFIHRFHIFHPLTLTAMNVAVNARFLIQNKLEGFGYFTREVIKVLAARKPGVNFHLFFDRDFGDFGFPKNVFCYKLPPAARHPLLWKYWFDVKVPAMLRKVKADVFLSPDGFCSLRTSVPQCIVVHDLGFLHQPDTYRKLHRFFYQYYTPRFLKKAANVATVSDFTKRDIIQQYRINEGKVSVVYNGVREAFRPLSFEDQFSIKEQYTQGKEYFICVGAIHPRKNLINLLKAFSIFKKRLRSEMKLVLAGRLAWHNDDFLALMSTYKYKTDVIQTGYIEEPEVAKLTAAAYASVYPSVFEGFGVPVIEAMKCNVPVLTSAGTAMQEVGADAALYFNPLSVEDMAEKLMLIYKDENLRKNLVEKGSSIAEKYTWEHTANLLWECIVNAANK